MTKSELIELLARKANLTKKKAEELVNTIFDAFFMAMVKGDRIEIRGFGAGSLRTTSLMWEETRRRARMFLFPRRSYPSSKSEKN